MIRISVITINYNQTEATLELLRSLPVQSDLEVIVIDNASENDPTQEFANEFPNVRVKRSAQNLGFAGGNNLGINMAKGKYLLFLNNDTIANDTIFCLADYLDNNPTVGAISPKVVFYNSEDIIQYAGYTPINTITGRNKTVGQGTKDHGQFNTPAPTAYLHGAAMMVRQSVIDTSGPMPEIYFLYYEELDWSESIRSHGFEIHYVPCCTILHKDSLSTGSISTLKTYYMTRNRLLFMRRNSSGLAFFGSLIYFLGIATPVSIIRNIIRGKWNNIPAIFKGLLWHLNHSAH